MMIPADIRDEADALGIPVNVLCDTYREFRQLARLEREPVWQIRQRVWQRYAYSVESWGFWRHGLQARFRRAFAEGDMDNIPRWDDVAQSMRCEFPELANVDDVSQHLFELLREPHDCLPSAEETWRDVLDYCVNHVGEWADVEESEPVPF